MTNRKVLPTVCNWGDGVRSQAGKIEVAVMRMTGRNRLCIMASGGL